MDFFTDQFMRVMDFFLIFEGNGLFLGREGNQYPDSHEPPFTYYVYRTNDLRNFDLLLTFSNEERFVSIAYWNDVIYFGLESGEIFRSTLMPVLPFL